MRAHPPVGRDVLQEAYLVGPASSVSLEESVVEREVSFFSRVEPSMKTSTLRDAEQGRRLEIEALSGSIVRSGHTLSIPTPVHAFIYAALLAARSVGRDSGSYG